MFSLRRSFISAKCAFQQSFHNRRVAPSLITLTTVEPSDIYVQTTWYQAVGECLSSCVDKKLCDFDLSLRLTLIPFQHTLF